jgi:hypothetical protein
MGGRKQVYDISNKIAAIRKKWEGLILLKT